MLDTLLATSRGPTKGYTCSIPNYLRSPYVLLEPDVTRVPVLRPRLAHFAIRRAASVTVCLSPLDQLRIVGKKFR